MAEVFKRTFLKIEVHDNRVEITEGMIPFRKHQTIPFSNISNVEVNKFTKTLEIYTNDGKKHSFQLGGMTGRKANKAMQAIVEKL